MELVDIFNVGKKNIDAVTYELHDMGLMILKADLRGNESKTLVLEVKNGSVKVRRQPILTYSIGGIGNENIDCRR